MRLLILLLIAFCWWLPVPANAQQLVECASVDGTLAHCPVDASGGAYLQRQHSRAACVENATWGYDRHGIWVSGGCRAEFLVGRPRQSKSAERNTAIAAAALITTALVIAAKHKHDAASVNSVVDEDTFEAGCMVARALKPAPESAGEEFKRGYATCAK